MATAAYLLVTPFSSASVILVACHPFLLYNNVCSVSVTVLPPTHHLLFYIKGKGNFHLPRNQNLFNM